MFNIRETLSDEVKSDTFADKLVGIELIINCFPEKCTFWRYSGERSRCNHVRNRNSRGSLCTYKHISASVSASPCVKYQANSSFWNDERNGISLLTYLEVNRRISSISFLLALAVLKLSFVPIVGYNFTLFNSRCVIWPKFFWNTRVGAGQNSRFLHCYLSDSNKFDTGLYSRTIHLWSPSLSRFWETGILISGEFCKYYTSLLCMLK